MRARLAPLRASTAICASYLRRPCSVRMPLGRRQLDVVVAGQELVHRQPGERPQRPGTPRATSSTDVAQDVQRVVTCDRRSSRRRRSSRTSSLMPRAAAWISPIRNTTNSTRRHGRRDPRDHADDQQDAEAQLQHRQPVADRLGQPLRRRVVGPHGLHERRAGRASWTARPRARPRPGTSRTTVPSQGGAVCQFTTRLDVTTVRLCAQRRAHGCRPRAAGRARSACCSLVLCR